MLNRYWRVVSVLVALALLAGVAWSGYAPRAQAAQAPSGGGERTITVVGRSEVKSAPDVAYINLGVEVLGPTVAEALDDADARMEAILDALEAAGIAPKDIQTSNFSINFERQAPEARPMNEESGPAGVYRVSNMVRVIVRDLEQVGAVIDAAVTAGANNVWGVSFGLEDTTALEAQAREKAVSDARARAESLAELNGVEVGEVVAISEVVGGAPAPAFAVAERAFGGGGSPIESGEVTFATQIQVVYAIR